ncbi:DUF5013 domain-containing protein [Pontibacter sp. XAAS-A31]|nr:DUF5013 domain-containing protein [Pontibacter harenae]
MLKKIRLALVAVLCSAAMISCSKWDEFKEFTKDGEIMYTGKIDSVQVLAGKGRVMYKGLISADPKVTKLRIFWNDFRDSVEYNLDKGTETGKVPFERVFDVDEGVKNFVSYTYDAVGNRSVPVNAVGTSYGSSYRRKINNRLISSLTFNPNNTIINWETMDLSTGAQFTEIEYDVDGETKHVVTPATQPTAVLEGLNKTTTIRYRTIFKPEATSIDTFAVAYRNYEVKVVPQLKNRQVPFIASSRSGRWGTLADWITNDAIKIHGGGHGGWDEWNGNIFNVESGWGAPAVTNGKVYQTLALDPGSYTFEISDLRDTNLSENDHAYIVVAPGDELPDVEQVSTAIGSVKIVNGKPVTAYKITFTVTEASEISMGYLTTQPAGDPGRFANIRAFNFYAN